MGQTKAEGGEMNVVIINSFLVGLVLVVLGYLEIVPWGVGVLGSFMTVLSICLIALLNLLWLCLSFFHVVVS